MRILNSIKGEYENLSISETGIENITEEKIPESDNFIVFVNSKIVDSMENHDVLISLPDIFTNSELVMFHSGGIPFHLLDVFNRGNVRFIPDGTKILTIINILAKAMNKEK